MGMPGCLLFWEGQGRSFFSNLCLKVSEDDDFIRPLKVEKALVGGWWREILQRNLQRLLKKTPRVLFNSLYHFISSGIYIYSRRFENP